LERRTDEREVRNLREKSSELGQKSGVSDARTKLTANMIADLLLYYYNY
jgi:hypothetical protein